MLLFMILYGTSTIVSSIFLSSTPGPLSFALTCVWIAGVLPSSGIHMHVSAVLGALGILGSPVLRKLLCCKHKSRSLRKSQNLNSHSILRDPNDSDEHFSNLWCHYCLASKQ